MRILIVTDAWRPQVNGVVLTYERLAEHVGGHGAEVVFLTPERFRTVPMPTYAEIRLSLATPGAVDRAIADARVEFVHIATEGPLGLLARQHCLSTGRGFTTSYHTRFPEYVSARIPVPLGWGYNFMRWFHNAGRGVMVVTQSLADELAARGFRRLYKWSRGVDLSLFRPQAVRLYGPAPVFLYVGRVAVEKNIEAFLKLDLPGRKVVVGGGPQLEELTARYPDAHFTGPKFGADLAAAYASADVFVFPSRTDTFGNVMLEALASGVPVAAHPVTGPKDLITDRAIGVLDEDLGRAARAALHCDRAACPAFASQFSWHATAGQFIANVQAACGTAGLRKKSPTEVGLSS